MGLSAINLRLRNADTTGMSTETQFTLDQLDTLIQNLLVISWYLERQRLDDRYLPVRLATVAAD